MLSPFLKKLMFVRQFDMADGAIEVLGCRQAMLPMGVVLELQAVNPERCYGLVKQGIRTSLEDYNKRIGATSEGVISITEQIVETYGLGRPQIVVLDNARKQATVRVFGAPGGGNNILPAIIAGMFSFIFKKDVDCTLVRQHPDSAEFAVK
jgi:hypothetical protein